MELVMLGSNAFAHIVEALILWMGMSQMYEARYKQVVTGLVIMVGHAIMFWVFLTGNIYVVTIVNNLIYILLIALLYNVSKRSAIFWAVIYNAMMAISELIMFFTARYIVGIENAGRKDTVDIMCSTDYKERFIAEYKQLEIRILGLERMLDNWDHNELNFKPTCPRSTYDLQLRAMKDYYAVLQMRAVMENIPIEVE